MSRESKILNVNKGDIEKTIKDYEAFGWELLGVNGKQVSLTRETQNPVFPQLVKFQAKYEDRKAELESLSDIPLVSEPAPISIKTCLITFVLLVVPFVIYISYKIKKKKQYDLAVADRNSKQAKIEAKRVALKNEIEQIVNDSRAVFFSKQN